MNTPPQTKITLINTIRSHPDSARWTEFFQLYEQPMRAYLAAYYPSLDADDIIQETLIALVHAMPTYVYSPKVTLKNCAEAAGGGVTSIVVLTALFFSFTSTPSVIGEADSSPSTESAA